MSWIIPFLGGAALIFWLLPKLTGGSAPDLTKINWPDLNLGPKKAGCETIHSLAASLDPVKDREVIIRLYTEILPILASDNEALRDVIRGMRAAK